MTTPVRVLLEGDDAGASPGVREAAVAAFDRLRTGDAVEELLTLVRTHASREVRRRAAFWLSRTGDREVAALLRDADV